MKEAKESRDVIKMIVATYPEFFALSADGQARILEKAGVSPATLERVREVLRDEAERQK